MSRISKVVRDVAKQAGWWGVSFLLWVFGSRLGQLWVVEAHARQQPVPYLTPDYVRTRKRLAKVTLAGDVVFLAGFLISVARRQTPQADQERRTDGTEP